MDMERRVCAAAVLVLWTVGSQMGLSGSSLPDAAVVRAVADRH